MSKQGDRLKLLLNQDGVVDPKTGLTTPVSAGYPEYDNLGKHDVGLVPGMNQQELRSHNQSDWVAVGNGVINMVTGAIGDIVAAPGYASGLFEDISDLDTGVSGIFLDAGNFIKELGHEVAPIYQGQAAQDAIFAPFNGEWLANTIEQFGSTVGLMAVSLATEGIATPALLSRIGQMGGKVGQLAKAANAFYTSGSAASKLLRTTNATFISRLTEGGMEAHETYKTAYNKVLRENPNISIDEAKKLAGEAGAKVWRENWGLAVLDFMQFKGIIDGFGKFGKLAGFAGEMGSEALEEGLQFSFQKEAEQEIDVKLGKTKEDVGVFETFFSSLDDPEMQKAMVQGALGGGVFSAIGSGVEKLVKKYQEKNPIQQELNIVDSIKESYKSGTLDVMEADAKRRLADTNISLEQKQHVQEVIDKINHFKNTLSAVNTGNQNVDVQRATVATEQFSLEKMLNTANNKLSELTTKVESGLSGTKFAIQEKLKALKKYKTNIAEKLTKKYEKEKNNLTDTPVVKSAFDEQISKAAKESIAQEVALEQVKEANKNISTKKGTEEAILKDQEKLNNEVDKEVQQENKSVLEASQTANKQTANFDFDQEFTDQEFEENNVSNEVQEASTLDFNELLNRETAQTTDEFADEEAMMNSLRDEIVQEDLSKSKYSKSKNSIQDLFNDITADFLLSPEAIEKGRNRSNKMAKILTELSEDLGIDPSFKDVVNAFEEVTGTKLSRQLKVVLGGFYTGITGIEVDINSVHEAELVTDKPSGLYTQDDNVDIDIEINNIEQKVLEVNADSSNLTSYEYKRVEFGNNLFAYLSRNYVQNSDGKLISRKEVSDNLNQDLENKQILDPNKFKADAKIKLRVSDRQDLQYYIPNSETKEKVSWEALKAMLPVVNSEDILLREEDMIPIEILDENDNLISYLHTIDWIKDENVYGDKTKDVDELRKIRQFIIENGEVNTEIISRSLGYLFFSKDNQFVDTSEAHPTGELVIQRNGKLQGAIVNPALNMQLTEGRTYSALPVGDDHIVVPLKHKQLSKQHIDSIMIAVELFINKSNLTPEQVTTNNKFKIAGYDLTTKDGFERYIDLFLYNFNPEVFDDLRQFVAANPISSTTHLFSIKANEIQFNISPNKVLSLSENTPAKDRATIVKNLAKVLNKHYYHTSLNNLNKKVQIPVIDNSGFKSEEIGYNDFVKGNTQSNILGQNIGTEENPNWIYTIQPKIRFNSSFAVVSEEYSSLKIKEIVSDITSLNVTDSKGRTYTYKESSKTDKTGLTKVIFQFNRSDKPSDQWNTAHVNLSDTSLELTSKSLDHLQDDLELSPEEIASIQIKEVRIKDGIAVGDGRYKFNGAWVIIEGVFLQEKSKKETEINIDSKLDKNINLVEINTSKGDIFSVDIDLETSDFLLSVGSKEDNFKILYTLKVISGLNNINRNKFNKSKLQGWLNDLRKQGVNAQQLEIFQEYAKDGMTKEEIIASISADLSFVVESNVAKKQLREVDNPGEYGDDEIDNFFAEEFSTEDGNTQFYSNLTVPGGTNYTENEIRTPQITPSIQGHAQFATNEGIGWFRSDEQKSGIRGGEPIFEEGPFGEEVLVNSTKEDIGSKTRRILELQSDLFQKGRDKETIAITGGGNTSYIIQQNDYDNFYSIVDDDGNIKAGPFRTKEEANGRLDKFKDNKGNQFLQLLNKDNAWITFFIKSIIQDSQKKGYEKVLFPKGNTAAKIEGHQTLEGFKRDKEARIKTLEKNYEFLDEEYDIVKDSLPDDVTRNEFIEAQGKQFLDEIETLKQEIADVESGKIQLSSIAKFYEETVGNILKKQYGKKNVKTITDEYGNQWNELKLNDEIEVIDLLLSTGSNRTKQLTDIQESAKELLIPGLSPMHQAQYISVIAEEISRKAFTEGNVSSKAINDVFEGWKKWFTENRDRASELNNEKVVIALSPYVEYWDTFRNLVEDYLNKRSGIKKVKEDIENLTEDEATFEKRSYEDSSSFEIDGKDTISGKLKRFLSFIPDGNKTYLRLHDTYVPFDDAYNQLSSILEGVEPDYNTQMAKLREVDITWVNNLINLLEEADGQVKNEFVVAMSKHSVNMIKVLWGWMKDKFKAFSFETNRNSKANLLIDNWFSNLKDGNNRLVHIANGEYKVDVAKSQELLNAIDDLEKNKTRENFKKVISFIGIELNDKTIEDLFSGNQYRYVRHGQLRLGINEMINLKGGLIKELKQVVTKFKHTPVKLTDNDIIRSGELASNIKSLAKHDAKYLKNAFSNSFRTGDKTVYSYTLSKHITSRYNKLLKPNSQLVKDLSNIAFSSTSTWLKHLREGNTAFIDSFNYYTADIGQLIKQFGSKSNASKKLNVLSPAEHEFAKVALFQAQNTVESNDGVNIVKSKVAKFFYPTMSDKTTMVILEHMTEDLGTVNDGEKVSDTAVNKVYDQIVKAEILRIQNYQNRNTKPNIKDYGKGAQLFLFFPELNNMEELFVTVDGVRLLKPDLKPYEAQIKSAIKGYLTEAVTNKIKEWREFGLIKGSKLFFNDSYMYEIGRKYNNPASVGNHIAMDYVVNYMLHNANVFQTFIGDPALFYKSKSKDYVQQSIDTFINVGKRLAGDLAPGYELANSLNNQFSVGFLTDRKSVSTAIKYYTKLLDDIEISDEELELLSKGTEEEKKEIKDKFVNSKDYFDIEGTDAQEFTTWKEHLYVMFNSGKLAENDYNKAVELLNAGKVLPYELLGKVMQPMKPVYVNNLIVDGVDRRIYIKSSSFPLLPQLTAGLEIDKLRIAMENPKNGVDRVAFGTAVKVGNTATSLNIWNEDGSVVDNIEFNETNSLTLSREGFRIQQEVPYKEDKDKINVGTQERKLLFNNILDITGFKFEGRDYTGKELMSVYNQLYKGLYEYKYKKFVQDIGYDGKTYNKEKLAKLLQKEALERGYDLNTRLSLLTQNGKFPIPLWALPSGNRIESLLTALVNNRINKIKFPGRSYVLGTEEGFQENKQLIDNPEQVDKLLKKYQSEIVFTNSWTGKLLPHSVKNGKFRPTQVLVPWNLRDKDGKLIDINQFIIEKDGKKFLDETKVPKELTYLFGFRIPTQGHNSMNMIEIVGFLPKEAGDLLIASRDFTKQMGSDFDIDKLYSYQYIADVKDGKLKKYEGEFEQSILNKILDIHFAVLSNPDTQMQKLIATPLAFGDLPNIANKVNSVREKKGTFLPLSDSYQRDKFINATNGKGGTGVFSLDSTFNALAQTTNLSFYSSPVNPFSVKFGNNTSKGELSAVKTLDGKKYKSDVIAAFQSAAVDNEKEQILGKLNINNHTFDAIRTLAQLGFNEETIGIFIAQDIIVDYVNELINSRSSLDEFNPTATDDAYKKVLAKYKAETFTAIDESLADQSNEKLFNYIENGKDSQDGRYYEAQIAILDKFLEVSGYGKSLQAVQSAINADSAGLGKSLINNYIKLQQVFRLGSSTIQNAETLLGNFKYVEPFNENNQKLIDNGYYYIYTDMVTNQDGKEVPKALFLKPTTISGFATAIAASSVNNIFGKEFPYSSTLFNDVVAEVSTITNASDLNNSQKEKLFKEVFDNLKSYIYSNRLLVDEDADEVRKRLLYDQVSMQTVLPVEVKTYEGKVTSLKDNQVFVFGSNPEGRHGKGAAKTASDKFGAKYGQGRGIQGQAYALVTKNISKTLPYTEEATGITYEKFGDKSVSPEQIKANIAELYQYAKNNPNKEFLVAYTDESNLNGYTPQELGAMFASTEIPSNIVFNKQFSKYLVNKVRLVGNQSLAAKIKKIQQTDLGIQNLFLNKLTVDINIDGSPSIIKFNAAASENYDENAIYASLIQLLTKEKNIEEFDNYTTTQLVEDIILYAYYTGGIQQAIQFVKYVPVDYLKKLSFGDKLNQISFENGDNLNINPGTEYYQPSNFTTQYVQHNPWKVSILDNNLSQIDGNSSTPKAITEFTLKDNSLYTTGIVDGAYKKVPPVFLSINFDKKWYLFKFDGVKYKKIPTYISFGVNEYNPERSLEVVNKVEKREKNINLEIPTSMSEIINHSGGAVGGDMAWDSIGKSFGVINHNHYTVNYYDNLNSEEKQELNQQYVQAAKFLGRNIIAESSYAGKLVRRDMIQANKSNAIYGITELVSPKIKGRKGYVNKMNYSIPEGGTGYAVARGIISRKPVYVFNQSNEYGNEIGWYMWKYDSDLFGNAIGGNFVKTNTPLLTTNFAGIGSTSINDIGIKAIKDVYIKTQNFINSKTSTFEKFEDASQIDIATSNEPTIVNSTVAPEVKKKLSEVLKTGNIKDILYHISQNSENKQFAWYAEQLIDISDNYNIKIEVNNESKGAGQHNYADKTSIIGINLKAIKSLNQLEQAILHELTHAITFKQINAFLTQPENLTNNQKRRLQRLESFRTAFIEKVGRDKMREFVNKYQEFLGGAQTNFTDTEVNTLYAGTSLKEFTAVIMTSPEFQAFMKDEIWRGDKSWWDRFVDLVRSIFDSLGIKFGDNLTKLAFEDVLSLANEPLNNISKQIALEAIDKTEEVVQEVNGSLNINGKNVNTGLPFNLNEQQVEFLNQAAKFIDSDKDVFTLSGSAGVGKTLSTKVLLKYINEHTRKPLKLAAPTHQAKQVLEKATNGKGVTVAKLIGLRPNMELEDFNLANSQFDLINEDQIPRNGIVIIDEASMINDDLYNHILSLAKKKGTKVIFIGDAAQIKPVKQKEVSKAFRQKDVYTLTKIMRTSDGNPLVPEVLTHIRNNQDKEYDSFNHISITNSKGEGISFSNDENSWLYNAKDLFKKSFETGNKNMVRFIAYTNNRVRQLNLEARNLIFGTDVQQFEKGEIIKGYKSLFYDYYTKDYKFHNSGEYEVTTVNKITKTIARIEVTGWELFLKDINSNTYLTKTLFVADNSNISVKYLQYLNGLKNEAVKADSKTRGRKWQIYYSAAEQYQVMGDVYIYKDKVYSSQQELSNIIRIDNPNYTDAQINKAIGYLKSKEKDLDYGYAQTSHRSQGSTFEYVFVDENNIDSIANHKNPDYDNLHKIKYVAFSRASKNVYSLSNKTEIPTDHLISSGVDNEIRNLENDLKLRNKDGSRKRYSTTTSNYVNLLKQVKEINAKLPIDKVAQMIKVMGEKGDSRVYYAIAIYNREIDYLPASGNKEYTKVVDNLNQQIRRLYDRIKNIKDKENNTKDKNQLKDLIHQRQVLENKIENKEKEVEALNSNATLEKVEEVLNISLIEAENIVNKAKVNIEEVDYAKRIIKFAKQAGTFDTDSHFILDDLELQDDVLVERFQKIRNRAEVIESKLDTIRKDIITDWVNNKLGSQYSEETIVEAIKDITGLAAQTLDISRYGDHLASTIYKTLKEAKFKSLEKSREKWKNIDELLEKALPKLKAINNSDPFDIFKQRTQDGYLTGDLTYYFSDKFFRENEHLWNRINKIKSTPSNQDGILSDSQKRRLSRLYAQKKAMSITMDVRKLFPRTSNIGFTSNFTQSEIDAHIEELKKHLGEKLYNKYYERLQNNVEQFELDFEIYRDSVNSDYSLSDMEKLDKIELWEKENSPYYAAVADIDGQHVTYANSNVNTKGNLKYSYNVPKRVTAQGSNTGYYDDAYLIIEQDQDIYNFYEYVIDTLYQMQKLIPNYKKKDWRVNTLPTIEKDIIEKFNDVKLGVGKELYDELIKATRRSDVSDIDYTERDVDGKPIKRVQLFVKDNRKKINDIVKQKEATFTVENPGTAITIEMRLQWKKEAKDIVAKEKSFDLGKITKAWSSQVISYHHKTMVEDIVNLLISMSTNRKEIVTNVAGEVMKDRNGNVVTQDGLANITKAINYYQDVMYGIASQAVEGKTDKKLLTIKEKKTKKELSELLTKNDNNLNSGRITQIEHLAIKDELEKQINELGGNVIGSKVGDMFLKWVQLKGMGWNWMSGISNMGFGLISNLVAAADGRIFTQNQYFQALGMVLNSIGKNISFHTIETETAIKIRNLMDKFDFAKDASTELYKSSNKSAISKKLRFLNPYQLQMRSEYVNQAPVMIAVALNMKLREFGIDKDGNLWSAFNVDGSWNSEYGEQPNLFKFKSKVDQAIKQIHGNYDFESPLRGKQTILGRALLQFRTWALESFANRYEAEKFDSELNLIRKGRYRSFSALGKEMGAGKALLFTTVQLLRKLAFRNTQFDLHLNSVDAANMRANLQEMVLFLAISSIMLMLKGLVDDDDDENYVLNILINQSQRLQTDILFYVSPTQFTNMIQDPMPVFSLLTDFNNLTDAIVKTVEGDPLMQSGIHEGVPRIISKGSKLLPFTTQLYRTSSSAQQIWGD